MRVVEQLLVDCPFLADHFYEDDLDLPTVIFGCVARLLITRSLTEEQELAVFRHINGLAENGDPNELEILGTGAIELFNDSAAAQKLAREGLTGRALQMLEDFRVSWGQPDYWTSPISDKHSD